MNKSFTLVTLYIIAFAGFTSISWMFPVVPYYTSSLGLNVYDTGLIVSIYSYVNAIFLIPAGIISDRWGRRTFLITGLVISTIAPFLYPMARDAATLYIVRILHGLGSSLFMPTALAVVTDLTGEGEHGKAIGWYTTASQLGLMAGPVAGGFILEHFGFEAAFYTCSLMPFLALIFLSTRMHAIPHTSVHRKNPGTQSWKWLNDRGLVISFIALVMIAVGSAALGTFIPLYVHQFNISEAGAGMIITSCYISSAALRIPAGTMADKLGNAPMIFIGMILCAAGIALIPAFHGLLELALVGLIFGLGMGFSMPASLSWLAKISPLHTRGFAMGLGSAAFQIGLALGSTVLGIIIHDNGFTVMYLATGAAIGIATLATLIVNKYGNRCAA